MTTYATPGGTVEASIGYGTTDLVGTIRVSIVDTPDGPVFLAPTTTGITEVDGVYFWAGPAPTVAGTYTVFWDLGAGTIGIEDLVVPRRCQAPRRPACTPPSPSSRWRSV